MYLRSPGKYLRVCSFSSVVAPPRLEAAAYTERRAPLPQPWAPGIQTTWYALSAVTAGARHLQGRETQSALGVPAVR